MTNYMQVIPLPRGVVLLLPPGAEFAISNLTFRPISSEPFKAFIAFCPLAKLGKSA